MSKYYNENPQVTMWREKYEALKEENESLQEDYEALQSEYSRLDKENNFLRSDFLRMESRAVAEESRANGNYKELVSIKQQISSLPRWKKILCNL